jgi:hypothetical protein
LLPLTLLILVMNLNWLRSAFGRAWMAIHHKDVAAEALGINVHLYKLLAPHLVRDLMQQVRESCTGETIGRTRPTASGTGSVTSTSRCCRLMGLFTS